jgi:hypothetical protein
MTVELPDAFWQGLEQFNQGEYYACHDTLEEIWLEAIDPPKSLYQGILQISVALYHLSNQNWKGAVILLGEGVNRVRRYEPDYAGVDVSDLLHQSAALLMGLQQAGPERAELCAIQLGLIDGTEADIANAVETLTAADVSPLQRPTIRMVENQ